MLFQWNSNIYFLIYTHLSCVLMRVYWDIASSPGSFQRSHALKRIDQGAWGRGYTAIKKSPPLSLYKPTATVKHNIYTSVHCCTHLVWFYDNISGIVHSIEALLNTNTACSLIWWELWLSKQPRVAFTSHKKEIHCHPLVRLFIRTSYLSAWLSISD